MWGDSEFNSTFSSPGGGANAGKEIKKNLIKSVIPVTCQTVNLAKQVEGENSVFEYNHLRFHQVCIVGLIRNVIKRANDVTYLVDDMTSSEISVKLQSDEADDIEMEESKAEPQTHFIENQYVKVFGIIKSLQNQKIVQAFKIIPLKELNEITHHMLECMNASIYLYSKANGDTMDMTVNNHHQTGRDTSTANNYEYGGNNSATPTSTSGLAGLNLNLANLIKQSKTNEGVHIKDMYKQFSNFPATKIKEALEFLSTEGQIYTTIDDEHFKSTDAM